MNQLQLKTRWRLQQYGFSVGRISELLESYKSSGFTHDDEQFVRYCLTNRESSSVLTKPRQLSWSPSSLVNSTLTQAGIPSSFIQSSLTDYLGTAKHAPSNVAFLDFCSRAYTKSSLNRLSKEPTYMVRGWLPDENVRKTLIDEGQTISGLMLLSESSSCTGENRMFLNLIGAVSSFGGLGDSSLKGNIHGYCEPISLF